MFEKYYNKLEPRDQKLRISEIKISGPDFTQVHDRALRIVLLDASRICVSAFHAPCSAKWHLTFSVF